MLVLRVNIDPNAQINEYFQNIKSLNIEALDNQSMPFELLVEKLNPHRSMQLSPLFQILINMDVASDSISEGLNGLTLSPVTTSTTKSKFDLSLNIVERDRLSFDFEYLTEIFAQQTIIDIGQHFLILIDSLLEVGDGKLSELSMLTAAEQHALTEELNPQDEAHITHDNIPILFDRQVLQRPDSVAVVHDINSLTYQQLQQRVHKVAAALYERGLQAGDKVAVLLPRDNDMLVCLLAILKCGAAYVPLNRDASRSRIELIIEDCQTRFLLTSSQMADAKKIGALETALNLEELLMSHPAEWTPPENISPDDLAYLIYTSGSTGKPKAVAITHGNTAA